MNQKYTELFRDKPVTRFHAMAKPGGPICNLDCHYCFYLSKEGLLHSENRWKMSPEILETYIKQYIESQNTDRIVFSWQGGEPTLMGLDFFKEVIRLEKKYCPRDKVIENDLQTNGTNITEEWCQFLKENNFLVGLSIDGPKSLHNKHRITKGQKGTFDRVMETVALLHQYEVPFNSLTCVNRETGQNPLKVYRFLRDEVKPRQMQFIPIVEPKAFRNTAPQLWEAEDMPVVGSKEARPGTPNSVVEDWCVHPEDFGKFLNKIFDEWYANDIGEVYVHYFEMMVGIWMGGYATSCTHSPMCGKGVAIEHDGTVYSCDHYVYPEYALGNVNDKSIGDMVFSKEQESFGVAKEGALPQKCKKCKWLFACFGECPKNRFIRTEDGELGLNYLCQGWQLFYENIHERLVDLCDQLRAME